MLLGGGASKSGKIGDAMRCFGSKGPLEVAGPG